MSPSDMEQILSGSLIPESTPFDPPTLQDWQRIESNFGCVFNDEFKDFMGLISKYQFPGDILNVSSGKTNGNDPIQLAYDMESRYSFWNACMIPFYFIGNGDYFCLNKSECPESRVYYFYSERHSFELYCDSFEEWVRQLPQFLA